MFSSVHKENVKTLVRPLIKLLFFSSDSGV
jgi:hypothetical protein